MVFVLFSFRLLHCACLDPYLGPVLVLDQAGLWLVLGWSCICPWSCFIEILFTLCFLLGLGLFWGWTLRKSYFSKIFLNFILVLLLVSDPDIFWSWLCRVLVLFLACSWLCVGLCFGLIPGQVFVLAWFFLFVLVWSWISLGHSLHPVLGFFLVLFGFGPSSLSFDFLCKNGVFKKILQTLKCYYLDSIYRQITTIHDNTLNRQ